jgi:hypothetical protein
MRCSSDDVTLPWSFIKFSVTSTRAGLADCSGGG